MPLFSQATWLTDNTLVRIDSITIEGNDKTRGEIIFRELNFDTDSSYSISLLINELIPRSVWNLTNLNLFNQVHIDTISVATKRINIRIRLVEKWYLWPIPFVEFADRNFNQWYRFDFDPYRTNYGIYLFKYNILGRNQTLKLSLVNGYNQQVSVHYKSPWFLKHSSLGLEFGSRYRSNREIWYKTDSNQIQFHRNLDERLIRKFENELRLIVRPALNKWVKPFVRHRSVKIADTVATEGLNLSYMNDGGTSLDEVSAGVELLLENRNNVFFPTKGSFLKSLNGYTKFIESNGYFFVDLEGGIYKRILPYSSRRLAYAIYGGVHYSFSDNLPYLYQKSLGYDRYVRGYEAYVIDGKAYGLLKAEFRIDVLKPSTIALKYMPLKSYKKMPTEVYFNLFSDYGYVKNTQTFSRNDLANSHLLGYGIGLNALFYYDKVFRFEYSFNKQKEHGLRLHFKRSF
jgi:outer membrane protein assembly factor BamA